MSRKMPFQLWIYSHRAIAICKDGLFAICRNNICQKPFEIVGKVAIQKDIS